VEGVAMEDVFVEFRRMTSFKEQLWLNHIKNDYSQRIEVPLKTVLMPFRLRSGIIWPGAIFHLVVLLLLVHGVIEACQENLVIIFTDIDVLWAQVSVDNPKRM